MGRIAVSFSLVLSAAVLAATTTACDVGALPGFTPDASMSMGSGSGSGSGSAVCEEIQAAAAPDGHHNEGMSCIAAGCHLAGQEGTGAPAYSYAGTLYKDAAGTQPYTGATIIVTLGGTERKVITAAAGALGGAGNFWITPGVGGLDSPTNAMTGTTRASGCPTVSAPMVGALVAGGGNCNNCHRAGAGATTTPVFLQ